MIGPDLSRRGYFAERIVVVPGVTRDALESVAAAMAGHDFIELR